jgi:hypothetical protein
MMAKPTRNTAFKLLVATRSYKALAEHNTQTYYLMAAHDRRLLSGDCNCWICFPYSATSTKLVAIIHYVESKDVRELRRSSLFTLQTPISNVSALKSHSLIYFLTCPTTLTLLCDLDNGDISRCQWQARGRKKGSAYWHHVLR